MGIAICVFLSSLFSGTETALTALTTRVTRQIMETGGRGSGVLQAWLDRPNRILATLLVGNNLTNIAASVLSVRVAFWFFQGSGPNAAAYADAAAVIGTTLLLLVFAEVSPKTFAKHNAARVAVPAMLFVRLVEYPLLPAAWVFTKLGRVVVLLLGGKSSTEGPSVTEEDIEFMIELGAREKVFEQKGRGQLLEAALEFGDTIAKEVMIPRTKALALDSATTVEQALEQVISRGHSRVPVYHASIDQIDGILYAKDLLRAVADEGISGMTIRSLARTPVFFVPETQKIPDTLREMQRRRVHLAVVVDEFGGFSGILTIEDILEELVGEIRDEYDREEELVRQLDEDTFIANALVSIHDLGEMLEVEFPDDGDYETLGGFVVAHTGKVPEVGSSFVWRGWAIEVVLADERHVERVRISRTLPTPLPETPSGVPE
jgi:CBS domain containing-hemolysin-like protein